MADKLYVKRRESRLGHLSPHLHCERRGSKRLLCSDLVQLVWVAANGSRQREIVILENLSTAGVGLFMGVAVPEGTPVELTANDLQLCGRVKHCVFRENGYIVGLELDSESRSALGPGRDFIPGHLLDVSLLDLE